jgi:hypothetical protein
MTECICRHEGDWHSKVHGCTYRGDPFKRIEPRCPCRYTGTQKAYSANREGE